MLQEKKIARLPKREKKKLMRSLKNKVKKFNRKAQRKLFLGDIGGALGANGGMGAGMLGAGAGLAMATMGADEEEEEVRSLESDVRNRDVSLMMTVNKRSGELGTIEARVSLLPLLYFLYYIVNYLITIILHI